MEPRSQTTEIEETIDGPLGDQSQPWSETSFMANLVGPLSSRNQPWWKVWAEWNANQTSTTTTTWAEWNASQTITTTTGGTDDDEEEPLEEEPLEEEYNIGENQSQTASSSTSRKETKPKRRRVDQTPHHMKVPDWCIRCESWGHHARACEDNSKRVLNRMNLKLEWYQERQLDPPKSGQPCWRCRKEGDEGNRMMDHRRALRSNPDHVRTVVTKQNIVQCNRCHGFNHIAASCLEPWELTQERKLIAEPEWSDGL